MSRKNKRLFLILVLIILVNVIVFLIPQKGSQLAYDESMFSVQDTAAMTRIRFFNEESNVLLTKADEGWELNGKYPVDESLRRLLFNILQRVKVKRPSGNLLESEVTVEINGEVFGVTGNATRTKTYFTKDEKSYEVEIPGYRDYLANIFELKSDQWRDRLIYNGSWRTIQYLKLDYILTDEDDFEIRFNDKFFEVGEVQKMDSSAVIDYLNQFQYMQANERLSEGRFAKYDSLSMTNPIATITIESINYSTPEYFQIYPSLGNERFHLIKNSANELMIFDQKRVKDLLRRRKDFKLVE